MPTHIDQLITDVTVESEPQRAAESPRPEADPKETWRHIEQQERRRRMRTRAEGFDD